jgi:predicted N-acetyltransferase YhbS
MVLPPGERVTPPALHRTPRPGIDCRTMNLHPWQIRRATVEDRSGIRNLIRMAGIHTVDPSIKAPRKHTRSLIRLILSFLIRGGFEQDFTVAVDGNGSLIGCVRIKHHSGGVWELANLTVDRAWRRRGIATDLIHQVQREGPRPLWGTCPDSRVDFYKRFGAVEIENPRRMPPILRRRQWWYTRVSRLMKWPEDLVVMVLEE